MRLCGILHSINLILKFYICCFSYFASITTISLCRSRRRQWHPTPVLLPGKSHGQRSLVGAVHGVAKSRARLSDFTFTFHFHALEKEMATHSSTLAWRIPGTGEPGGLPSMGSLRVRHDWSDLAAAIHYLTKSFFKTYLKLPSLHIYCSVSCSVVSDSTTPWTATATLVQVITIYHLSWNLLQ